MLTLTLIGPISLTFRLILSPRTVTPFAREPQSVNKSSSPAISKVCSSLQTVLSSSFCRSALAESWTL